ncbi:MAG: hypothetical protein M3Y08_13960 [Fibrobacterota bacterium]|nr:hypothetical protein [Fibrobacterota bacterium]
MAKHDHRILKFLNQNADRAPTITEMMTRLNISISDISESLESLQAQNLIAKKTNNQGIECWFPNSPVSVQQPMPPIQATPQHFATQQIPIQMPMAMEWNPDARAVQGFTGIPERLRQQAPEPKPPAPNPVPVQHIPIAEPVFSAASSRGEFSPQPAPQMAGSMPMYGLSQPAKGGVGGFTLLMGLAVAVGLSVFLGHRLTSKEIGKASKDFVNTKTLTEATADFKAFQEKTKIHVTALEADIKKLTAELASSKAAAESLKTVAAVKSAEEPAKSKGKKSLPIVKAKAKSSSASAIAKAAARGAAKKRKASASGYSARETSEYTSSSESSYSDPSPSVPEPPGLEDLPSAPAE